MEETNCIFMAMFKSLLVWILKTWCSFATGCFLGNKVYWVFIGAIIPAPAAVQRPGKKQTDKERLPIHWLLMGPSQNCHPRYQTLFFDTQVEVSLMPTTVSGVSTLCLFVPKPRNLSQIAKTTYRSNNIGIYTLYRHICHIVTAVKDGNSL